jgi:hypothetical protein
VNQFERYAASIVSGVFMTLLTYMLVWFFARNVVDGNGPVIENGAAIVVLCGAFAVGWSSALKQWRRG